MIQAASSEEVKGRRDRIRGKEKFMGLPAFDTLQIFEDLEKAGFDEPKAKAISAVVRKVHDSSDVATKADLQHLEERVDTKLDKLGTELRHEIGDLRKDMDAKHESLRKDIDTKLANMKFDLLRWFFGIALAQTGLLVALKLCSDSRRYLLKAFLNKSQSLSSNKRSCIDMALAAQVVVLPLDDTEAPRVNVFLIRDVVVHQEVMFTEPVK